MSTGDVHRPAMNKISAKAVAAGGKKTDEEDAKPTTASPKPPGAKARPAAKSGSGGGRGPAKAGGGGRGPGKPGGGRGGGGKGRKPVTPVRVAQGRNWGPLMMFAGAGLVALLIIGFGVYALVSRPDPTKWKERAEAIPGLINYYKTHPDWVSSHDHKNGVLTYPMSPPAGGTHNPIWQNCMGDVYPAEIPKEQATHSQEHGAVWVTYNPSLPKDQIDKLKSKVEGKPFTLMSPYPNLDSPISLQTWGYQLKVSNADDSRIDDFITNLAQNATSEPGAGCSGGITETGATPLDLNPAGQPTP